VPKALLVDGANRFRLLRSPQSPADSELYHFWFLQAAAPAAPATSAKTPAETPAESPAKTPG